MFRVRRTTNASTDTVMVLPFENTSDKPEFNWVGESFADSLSDLLRVPELNVVSNERTKNHSAASANSADYASEPRDFAETAREAKPRF